LVQVACKSATAVAFHSVKKKHFSNALRELRISTSAQELDKIHVLYVRKKNNILRNICCFSRM